MREIKTHIASCVGRTIESIAGERWGSDDDDLKNLEIRFMDGSKLHLHACSFIIPEEPSISAIFISEKS